MVKREQLHSIMVYIHCQNYMFLLCDIDIPFCNMHGLFGYLLIHYAIFVLHYATRMSILLHFIRKGLTAYNFVFLKKRNPK